MMRRDTSETMAMVCKARPIPMNAVAMVLIFPFHREKQHIEQECG